MRRTVVLIAVVVSSCGKRHEPDAKPKPPYHAIEDLDGLPGDPCGSPLMVTITMADGTTTFCIDRFEASLDGGAIGSFDQGAGDPTDMSPDGSTLAEASVALGVTPASDVSWYQAKDACANAGKRLCTVDEWERACRGPEGFSYPYGNTVDESSCVGFFTYPEQTPERTGSRDSCGSVFGVYDLSGNLEEWAETAVPRVPGTIPLNDRNVRGGSFRSNASALACTGTEFHEPPASHDTDRGFRCCADGPL